MHRCALCLHAAVVVLCRGALFFPLALNVAGKLREIEDPGYAEYAHACSDALVFPTIFMGLFNLVVSFDAIKAAMWCGARNAPAGAQHKRPLRVAIGADDANVDACDTETSSHAPELMRRERPLRKPKSTVRNGKPSNQSTGRHKLPGDGSGSMELNEEMTFGFASSDVGNPLDDTDADGISPGSLKNEAMHIYGGRAVAGTRTRTGSDAGTGSDSKGPPQCLPRVAVPGLASGVERARLRRETNEATRGMEPKRDQQHGHKKIESVAQHAHTRCSSSAPGIRVVREPVQIVDHDAIFSTGRVPKKATHYSMLGVPKSAETEEIKRAFRQLSVKWHPDKNPTNAANAEVVFMGIKDAYECLVDATRRRRYDKIYGAQREP